MADPAPAAAGRPPCVHLARPAAERLRDILTAAQVVVGPAAHVSLTPCEGTANIRVHATHPRDRRVSLTAGIEVRGATSSAAMSAPAGPLARLLTRIAPAHDVELTARGNAIVLRAGRRTHRLPATPAVAGAPPWRPGEVLAQVDAVALRRALTHLEPVLASARAHRRDLDLVRVESLGDTALRLAATDLRGLTLVELPATVGTAQPASVEGRRFSALRAILGHGPVSLAVVNGGHLAVHADPDAALVLAAGPLGSIDEHLPGPVAGVLTLSAAALREAVTRLGAAERPLHLLRDSNCLRIDGPDRHEHLAVSDAAGQPLDCWLQPALIQVALHACGAGRVTLACHSGRGLLVPVTFQSDVPGVWHLLKPCLPPRAG